MNAPAPLETEAPPLEYFGITRNCTTLGEIVRTRNAAGHYCDAEVQEWIIQNIAQRSKNDLLGSVTLTHGEITYGMADIATEQAKMLVDLHDLLVDSDKQGYRYTEDAWRTFKRRNHIPSNLPKPAYRRFTRPPEDGETNSMHEKPGDLDFDADDIIDRLYFEVVMPQVKQALRTAHQETRNVPTLDNDLTELYRELRDKDSNFNKVVAEELTALRLALKGIRTLWADVTSKYAGSKKSAKVWELGLGQCREAYKAIAPVTDQKHPTIAEWVRERRYNLTRWEEIKASTFAYDHHVRFDMIFNIAGFELCQIKAFSQGLPRVVCEDMWLSLKPRKRKADDVPLNRCGLDDSDGNEDSRSQYASDSLIDAMESIDELPMPNAPPVPPKPAASNF